MWYRDFQTLPTIRAAYLLADHFDTNYPTARAIVMACREAYELGSAGKDPGPLPLATRDPLDLVKDAYLEGVQRKDRVVVKLESRACQSWGPEIAADHSNCEDCGGTGKDLCILATVTDQNAELWADGDQTIAGDTWEVCDSNQVYAMPVNHAGLVEELRAEGYRLDLSNYEAP